MGPTEKVMASASWQTRSPSCSEAGGTEPEQSDSVWSGNQGVAVEDAGGCRGQTFRVRGLRGGELPRGLKEAGTRPRARAPASAGAVDGRRRARASDAVGAQVRMSGVRRGDDGGAQRAYRGSPVLGSSHRARAMALRVRRVERSLGARPCEPVARCGPQRSSRLGAALPLVSRCRRTVSPPPARVGGHSDGHGKANSVLARSDGTSGPGVVVRA